MAAEDFDNDSKSTRGRWDLAGEQYARFASVEIAKDEIILDLKPLLERMEQPSAYTLQLAEGDHYRVVGGTLGLNHHCSPNGYIRFEDLTYRALRDILPGEELTFHYCTTEYELADPFDCLCGSPDCLGRIRGFKFLEDREVEKISSFLSPFLRGKLATTNRES